MSQSPQDIANLEAIALGSVSRVERVLFAGALRRNIRNPRSRFSKAVPRYGVAASARIIAVNLWLLPLAAIGMGSVILNVVTSAHSASRMLSYAMLGVCLGGCFVLIVRAVLVSLSGFAVQGTLRHRATLNALPLIQTTNSSGQPDNLPLGATAQEHARPHRRRHAAGLIEGQNGGVSRCETG